MTKKTEKKAPKAKKEQVPSKPSTVENPVKVVHETCDRMLKANPKLARKDVMAALAGKVNAHTMSTQWQQLERGAEGEEVAGGQSKNRAARGASLGPFVSSAPSGSSF